MRFKVLDRFETPNYKLKNIVYLTWDGWNDYSYYTLFGLLYADEESTVHEIGSIKIGFYGQVESERKFSIGQRFNKLDNIFFSLGQSDQYYENLNNLGENIRDAILIRLNDIAKNPIIYNKAIKENVTRISLLRTISPITVTGQFRRMANGGVKLTPYSFNFFNPKPRRIKKGMTLSFEVVPESAPPSNIHVLIGRNGVGKTHLLTNMINSLIEDDADTNKYGEFNYDTNDEYDGKFANLISVTFSAFDESEPKPEYRDKTRKIQYSYIGLKRMGTEKNYGPKSTTMLNNEFYKSLCACISTGKSKRWRDSISMLESDSNFKEAEVSNLITFEDLEELKTEASEIFRRLSSGHKIVLLTMTRLIETLQEKSLVLIDEPEAHLHPPLLSAFIRTLSELLSITNGVAIIATHSPVILQEVPRSCVWKMRRAGSHAVAERLEIESFGENVGVLTREIFGLEVTNSGFYTILNDAVNDHDNYKEVIKHFNKQLGMEARALVMSLFANK